MSALALAASIVEWGDLGATVVASVITGVGITVAFAFAILGAAQFTERRRQGELAAAAGAAALAVAGLAVCTVGIVVGMAAMLGD